jgi:hypothetical protein
LAHDITAISRQNGDKISYLNITAFDQGKSCIFYDSLNCNEFNSGVSGNGGRRILTESELKTALAKFRYLSGESEDEIEFIVSSNAKCRSSKKLLAKVLSAIGIKSSGEEVKVSLDQVSVQDVERFLNDLQSKGDVLITFA